MDDPFILPEPISHSARQSGRKQCVSSFVKGGLGLLVAANVDMIIAFSTSYWATWKKKETGESGGYGLWKIWDCVQVRGGESSPSSAISNSDKLQEACVERLADTTWPAWYVATQVMECLGLAGLLTSLIMLLLYIFLPQWERNRVALSSLIGISYFSGVCIIVGLVVFGYHAAGEIQRFTMDWFLSWSFSLACTAFVLNQIAASVLVTENKRLFASSKNNDSINKQLLHHDFQSHYPDFQSHYPNKTS